MIEPDESQFWEFADRAVREHSIVIDRPRGSHHPCYMEVVYPLDYGFLDGTTASDGGGVDCWRGSLEDAAVTGSIVTVDVYKADCEVKWLIDCTGGDRIGARDTPDGLPGRDAHPAAQSSNRTMTISLRGRDRIAFGGSTVPVRRLLSLSRACRLQTFGRYKTGHYRCHQMSPW